LKLINDHRLLVLNCKEISPSDCTNTCIQRIFCDCEREAHAYLHHALWRENNDKLILTVSDGCITVINKCFYIGGGSAKGGRHAKRVGISKENYSKRVGTPKIMFGSSRIGSSA